MARRRPLSPAVARACPSRSHRRLCLLTALLLLLRGAHPAHATPPDVPLVWQPAGAVWHGERRRDGRSRVRALRRLEPVARRDPGRTQRLEQHWIVRGLGQRTAARGERSGLEGGPQRWGTVTARGYSLLSPPLPRALNSGGCRDRASPHPPGGAPSRLEQSRSGECVPRPDAERDPNVKTCRPVQFNEASETPEQRRCNCPSEDRQRRISVCSPGPNGDIYAPVGLLRAHCPTLTLSYPEDWGQQYY
ncbi:hypothetical protein NDU88_005668 [Pleurodeles waltl]|uniref:Uncharacterized protein n=1 Tax=Pleurodeles waltl TaxID=8319 RepID=A0AAV7LNF1_PLEWA|nr:hypothetical protein NDU88_005668 [Pleurodeles waltl]